MKIFGIELFPSYDQIHHLDASRFQSTMDEKGKKVQLIDVRTPAEYQSGHRKGAKNINVQSPTFGQEIAKLDKNQPVFVYCRSGARSGMAAKRMAKMGFTEIYNLRG